MLGPGVEETQSLRSAAGRAASIWRSPAVRPVGERGQDANPDPALSKAHPVPHSPACILEAPGGFSPAHSPRSC